MTARRKVTSVAALAFAPLAIGGLAAVPAFAHGSMTAPVSRVSVCFAEGPESPKSAACKAAVAASGTQAFYDWNEVNIANAAGNHKRLIPDGKLCSAGRAKYKGLDLPRRDWPSSKLASGKHTFRYKATAPHKGAFALYVTKDGYNPAKRLAWSDLEAKPFAKVTNPRLVKGEYVFGGVVPKKSGRHLIYSIWQRSDSPEAFYTCSDVVFGKGSGGKGSDGKGGPAATPSAPSDKEIAGGAGKSTVDHDGHGGDHAEHSAAPKSAAPKGAPAGNAPEANGAAAAPAQAPAAGNENLAETGGDSGVSYLALGGAGALALGAMATFGTVRCGRHSR